MVFRETGGKLIVLVLFINIIEIYREIEYNIIKNKCCHVYKLENKSLLDLLYDKLSNNGAVCVL